MRKIRNFPAAYPLRLALLGLVSVLCFDAFGETSVTQASGTDQEGNDPVLVSEGAGLNAPERFGWIEKIILSPELQWKLDAKLDTGADTSSLDAIKIRRVRFKGKRYVRFSIRNPESGEMISLRRPYVRTVRIRQHSGNHQRRYVVLMTVCLGTAERTIEVTLTDREDFDYPVLLGRSALAGLAVVDSLATYTSTPNCRNQFLQDSESVDKTDPVSLQEPKAAQSSPASLLKGSQYLNQEAVYLSGTHHINKEQSANLRTHVFNNRTAQAASKREAVAPGVARSGRSLSASAVLSVSNK